MSDTGIRFLSWVRGGLASGGLTVDPLSGALPARLPVRFEINLEGSRQNGNGEGTANPFQAGVDVRLYGPGDVTGIDPRQIIRTDPRPDTAEFEPNYLVTIEFDRPDLPWLFTPAVPDTQGRLRPWLFLVVVPEGVAWLETDPVRLTCPRVELPDLDESWAWAHAQVTLTTAGELVKTVLTRSPERNLSRIISPRRLEPRTRYLACLVPAFEAGRLAGLGQQVPDGDTGPAWAFSTDLASDDVVTLPVYFYWRFGTSEDGDFEGLARRLRGRHLGSYGIDLQRGVSLYPLSPEWPTTPVASATNPDQYVVWIDGILQNTDRYSISVVDDRLHITLASTPSTTGSLRVLPRNPTGERLVDITDPGSEMDPYRDGHATIPLQGALRVPETNAAPWSEPVRQWFQSGLEPLLRGSLDRLVLSPPTYGSIHAGIDPGDPAWPKRPGGRTPNAPVNLRIDPGDPAWPKWLKDLNLDPRYRIAASLGTRVIQEQQERLMEVAWQQAAAQQADAQRAAAPLGHPLRAANQLVRQGQLAIAAQSASFEKRIGSSNISRLGDARLLELAPPLTGAAGMTENPVAASVISSTAFSTAFRRISRPLGPIMRRVGRARQPLAYGISALALAPTPREASLARIFSGQVIPATSLSAPQNSVNLAAISGATAVLADIASASKVAGGVCLEDSFQDGVRTAPGAAMHGRRIFVGSDSGRLFEMFNDGVRWLWFDHGLLPNNERMSSLEPSNVFDDSSFFVISENGNLFERFWDGDRWAWREHGMPSGSNGLATAPSHPQVSVDFIHFFFCGQNGELYEYRRNHSSGVWEWIGHCRPNENWLRKSTPYAGSWAHVTVVTDEGTAFVRAFVSDWLGQHYHEDSYSDPYWHWVPLGKLNDTLFLLDIGVYWGSPVYEATDGNLWRPGYNPGDDGYIVQRGVHARTNAQWDHGGERESEFRTGTNGHLIESLREGYSYEGPTGEQHSYNERIFDHGAPPPVISTGLAQKVMGPPAYLPGDGVFVTTKPVRGEEGFNAPAPADDSAFIGRLGHIWWDQSHNAGAGAWLWEDFGTAHEVRGRCQSDALPPQDLQALPLGFLNNLLVAHIDNPAGDNRVYYRLGRNTGLDARVERWDEPKLAMSEPIGFETQGLGVAVADIKGIPPDSPETARRQENDRRRDLIILYVDNPDGPNNIFYRVGFDLGAKGTVEGGWSPVKQCPFPVNSEIQGIDLAVADLDGDGHPELIVAYVTGGPPPHHIFYRIGWRLDNHGDVTCGWSYSQEVPGTPDIVQGVGVAVADMNDDDRRDLMILTLEREGSGNRAIYRIGYGLNGRGNIVGGWSEPRSVGGAPFGPEYQGAGIIVADFTGSRRPDLLLFTIENRPGENRGWYRVGWDLDRIGIATSWSESNLIPGWFGAENQGGAIALADVDEERLAREQMRDRFREAAAPHHAVVARAQGLAQAQEQARSLQPLQLAQKAQDTAQEVRQALDPVAPITRRVQGRISLMGTSSSDDSGGTLSETSPTSPLRPFIFIPSFRQPMYEALRDISQEFLFPGAANVPPETVALVTTNADFIESFMVGLNHEFSREMLWREYPGDRRATFFRQFWDVRGAVAKDGPLTDIEPIANWESDAELGGSATAVGSDDENLIVLLVRGELLRRYPSAMIYARKAASKTNFDQQIVPPQFWGRLDPDLLFFGLPLTRDQACGDDDDSGWFIVIQQPPTDVRFGLDSVPENQYGGQPGYWSQLHWGHLADAESELRELRHIRLGGVLVNVTLSRSPSSAHLTWAFNSAHMAQITYQPPFQIAWHASTLLPR